MTDIVERLRRAAVSLDALGHGHDLYDQAADEIERLRSSITEIAEENERLRNREARIAELAARNTELRERIEELTRERDALWEQDRYLAEIERLRACLAADESIIKQLREMIDGLRTREARIVELVERNTELRERIVELTIERDALGWPKA